MTDDLRDIMGGELLPSPPSRFEHQVPGDRWFLSEFALIPADLGCGKSALISAVHVDITATKKVRMVHSLDPRDWALTSVFPSGTGRAGSAEQGEGSD